jgi:hypothetical protein
MVKRRALCGRCRLCADIDGFSLHAAVRVGAHDRKRLEQRCRYITRPAVSDELVQLNAAGQVELQLKTPWRDGTTHLVMSPLQFMQRLAALVPDPRAAGGGDPDSHGPGSAAGTKGSGARGGHDFAARAAPAVADTSARAAPPNGSRSGAA